MSSEQLRTVRPPFERTDGSNVLVLAPSMDDRDAVACAHLLDADEPANTVVVALSGTPDSRLDVLRRHGVQSNAVGAVCCGESVRGAAAVSPAASGPSTTPSYPTPGLPTVVSVPSPADLTGIGMQVGRFLSAWADAEEPVRICLHSLTVLLQHVDPQRAFRFMHVLTQRIAVADAVAHYHMDPVAHDSQVVSMMRSLCDVTVELDDGEWIVHR